LRYRSIVKTPGELFHGGHGFWDGSVQGDPCRLVPLASSLVRSGGRHLRKPLFWLDKGVHLTSDGIIIKPLSGGHGPPNPLVRRWFGGPCSPDKRTPIEAIWYDPACGGSVGVGYRVEDGGEAVLGDEAGDEGAVVRLRRVVQTAARPEGELELADRCI